MFNAFFAKGDIIALDNVNTSITGGWLDHNWKQLYIHSRMYARRELHVCYDGVNCQRARHDTRLEPSGNEVAEALGMDEDQYDSYVSRTKATHVLLSVHHIRSVNSRRITLKFAATSPTGQHAPTGMLGKYQYLTAQRTFG